MDKELVPLSTLLNQLLKDRPHLRPPSAGPWPPSSAPLYARRPELAMFPADRLAGVLCRSCHGWGARPQGRDGEVECADCGGSGLCCPTCHATRWLVDAASPLDRRTLLRCPTCPTPAAEAAAIVAHLRGA